MRRFLIVISTAIVFALAQQAHAVDGDDTARHGGIMNWNENSEYTLELVVAGREATLYIEDHGALVPTAGAKGVLSIKREAATRTATLDAAGGNRMAATDVSLVRGDRVTANVTLGNGTVMLGRFIVP